MKTKALLKCIGLICIWFLSLQFFSILFRNADITRILSILIVGILVFCMNRKNHYICFVPEENRGCRSSCWRYCPELVCHFLI